MTVDDATADRLQSAVSLWQVWDERDRRYALSRIVLDEDETRSVRLWRLAEAKADAVAIAAAANWTKPPFLRTIRHR